MNKNTLHEALYDTLEDGIYFVDADQRIIMWNRAAEKITGYTAEEVVGDICPDQLLNHIDLEGRPLGRENSPLSKVLREGERCIDETMIRHKSGYRIAVLSKFLPVYGEDNTVTGAAEIFTPRTRIDDGRLVDAPSSIVTVDALTGLPNRAHLENTLQYKFTEHKGTGVLFCVLCMNVDGLDEVNRTYGHQVGDELLTAIASELRCNLRRTDSIGRWDSRVFLGLFAIRNSHVAYLLGERVRGLVAGCHVWSQGQCVHVTASVGVAIIRSNDTQDSIVERACYFMQKSKMRGKDCVSVEDMESYSAMLANA